MANINLAPGTQYLAIVRRRRRRILMISVLLLVLMFVIWGGLFFVSNDINKQNKRVADQIGDIDINIVRLGEDGQRVLAFEQRLEALDQLLNQHVSWDVLLNDLERLLPQSTVLSSISVDLDRSEMSVEGFTTDMDVVAQTLASLSNSDRHNTIFTQASFGGISRESVGEEGESRVRFDVNFTFDKSRFSNNQ